MTEHYQGVKFSCKQQNPTFRHDTRIEKLNYWAYLFSELGLAPRHSDGAYGNFSYRTGEHSFIITKSGMIPTSELHLENYCHVVGFDKSSTTFITEGTAGPSSECFLHSILYSSQTDLHAILHGHFSLLNLNAEKLKIKTTNRFYEYGTAELAFSALELARSNEDFFILRDHGFVALGRDIDSAGRLTLDYLSQLLDLLRK